MTTKYVIVETMPEQHIASHQAAGNWGTYPHNGAVRETVTEGEAAEIIEADEHGYARIVEELGALDSGACTDHEDVEGWYDSLGWQCDWDSEHDGGQVSHPVCSVDQLRTMTDAEILAAECPEDASDEERGAYESALAYAREALSAAEAVVAELEEAVEAYEVGDDTRCIAALKEASRLEGEYGDDPAARNLAEQLLIGGYDALRNCP